MAKATPVGDEFVDGLISDLNKQLGEVAYNLAGGTSPTEVNTFVSSGSVLLDTILANRRNGGFPVGRISEIVGEEATGKSLIALHALKNTQKQGGVAILIDTENATSVDLLRNIGIDVSKMMYMQLGTVEEVFEAMERIIKRIREKGDKRLVTIVWDSVAATSTKAEVEGEYGDYTIGLAARLIAQGLRKITQFIGKMNV
jgi:recombination protein RecA